MKYANALKPVHTGDGDNLSPKTTTVAEKCDCRRIRRLSPLSRRFRRQSHFSATVWTELYRWVCLVLKINECTVKLTIYKWTSRDF